MISKKRAPATTVAGALFFCGVALLAHDPISTKVTWEREIGPIVQARCVSCHSPGGRAPMPLTTYEEARPWARAIREEVLTRRMPMWHVVRGYGDFSNDPSLSPFEVALFAAWADGGAPAKAPDLKVGPTRGGLSTTPPAVLPAGPTVGRTFRSGVSVIRARPAVRSTDVACTARALPTGRLVGVKPVLREGADLRVTVTHADGTQEPLLWVRGFDPAFADTYWLRTPMELTRATRVAMDGPAPCTLTVLLEAKTAR
jgi:hypothetical protein